MLLDPCIPLDFQEQLKTYEGQFTKNLTRFIQKAKEGHKEDLENLVSNHIEGPFNDLRVREGSNKKQHIVF